MRWVVMTFLGLASVAHAADVREPTDPFLWLENQSGQKALDWVRTENARTLGELKGDHRYQEFFDAALKIAEAQDRLPAPAQLGGKIYNFWQDADHVRGLWRRTTLDTYRSRNPDWEAVLDIDALAAREHANWVWKGADCKEPEERICLVSLSDGGEDAVVTREFDLDKKDFVSGGFSLPRAKVAADWESDDALLVATDWGKGSLTESGYPFVVKRLKRGQQLADAVEIFRGKPSDVGVGPASAVEGDGTRVTMIGRDIDAFHAEIYVVTATGLSLLPIPQKAAVSGLLGGKLLIDVNEDFTPAGGAPVKAGSLIALDAKNPGAPPVTIFSPGPRQSLEEVAVTKTRLLAAIYDNVRGRAYVFTPGDQGWSREKLDLPDNESVGVVSTDLNDDNAFLGVSGFLQPSSLFYGNVAGAEKPALVKTAPARFDASKSAVDQLEATSEDGTKIPYFVVHPKDMKLDGSNPTLLTAYGGFQVSELPSYSPVVGKLWLERGGVYVLANIRGGGEFGPAWHEAALKTHRQRAYDDFAAVAQDLIARKITSPRRLGIEGGSNGGLLMGVEFEQHPDLWNAAVIEVPLLDMLRFEDIDAGSSWTGEYGSVSNPEERAFLASISPYQNLKRNVKYPEPFIYTTTKDDRVGPQHARKFAAKMKSFGLPYLYYEAIEGGHGAGVNAREIAEERALEMTYLARKLMDE